MNFPVFPGYEKVVKIKFTHISRIRNNPFSIVVHIIATFGLNQLKSNSKYEISIEIPHFYPLWGVIGMLVRCRWVRGLTCSFSVSSAHAYKGVALLFRSGLPRLALLIMYLVYSNCSTSSPSMPMPIIWGTQPQRAPSRNTFFKWMKSQWIKKCKLTFNYVCFGLRFSLTPLFCLECVDCRVTR